MRRPRAHRYVPRLEPFTQQIAEKLAELVPLHALSPAEARSTWARRQAAPIGKPTATTDDRVLPVGPTGSVDVRIVRPVGAMEPVPVMMYFHGGGWMLGDRTTHDRVIREIAVGANAALVFVEYSRAPECQFPVAVEQAYAATRYVVDNARALNVDGIAARRSGGWRRRQPRRRGRAIGQGAARAEDRPAIAVLSGDRREFRPPAPTGCSPADRG